MKFNQPKLTAIAVASAMLFAVGCSGDKEPVQDVTFVTYGSASGATVAFGYSADRGVHFAKIDSASTLNMAVKSQAGGGGGGGGGFFSGSVGGSTSFSGSTGGSVGFSGATGGSVGFSGSAGGSTGFSGTAILNGVACDLSAICDLAATICASADAECGEFSESQCQAAINTREFQESLAESFGGSEELAAVFCVFIDFLSCLFDSAPSFDAIDEDAALQCAEDAGLVSFSGSSGL